jgi:hypothetical protein
MGAIRDAIAAIARRVMPEEDLKTTRTERQEQQKPAGVLQALMQGSAWEAYEERMKADRTRMARYKDYELFDEEDSLAAGVLDVYADHALHSQETEELQIQIETKSDKTKQEIASLFDRVQLPDLLWPLTRDMVKCGDAFEEHVFNSKKVLVEIATLDRTKLFRTGDRQTPLEERDATGRTKVTFAEFEATHLRLRRTRSQQYGASVLAPVRKVYKQIAMMEDSIVVRRLTRATQRYGFMVPTGNLAGEEARKYVMKVRDDMKKRRLVTADGKLALRDAPMFQDEDFFLAQPNGEKADIKVLQGDGGLGDIADIQHFLNKFFGGVKVPKNLLRKCADVSTRATLTEQAIAFARAARRVQVAVRMGLHHIVDAQYLAMGIDPTTVEYRILLPAMSTVDEMRNLEVAKLRAELAKLYLVDMKVITPEYVLTEYLKLPEAQALELLQDLADQQQMEADAQVAAQQAMEAQKAPPPGAPAQEERIWREWRIRQLTETARAMALWSLEHQAWERAQDPLKGDTVVYLGD